jgi:hypothetical protein
VKPHSLVTALFAFLTAAPVIAQSGQLDQVSPLEPPKGLGVFYGLQDPIMLTWQQQIRAGIDGRLEGVRIRLSGQAGLVATVRIRRGEAWSLNPILAERQIVKSADGDEIVFVDFSAIGISISANELFVMETFGVGSQMLYLIGSHVDPAMGDPLYPEPLVRHPVRPMPGYRHGFETYMLPPAPPCVGDANHSGRVTLEDLAILLAHFGDSGGATPETGDCDNDADVDLDDLGLLLVHFGATCE